MKFPVLKGEAVWPRKPLCPQCRKNKVMEPHSMAILTGGAMRIIDRRSQSAGIADDCVGFLDLVWHGAHDGGSGINPDVHVRVPIAEDTPDGQFEFYFCSSECLRSFFNTCVDALEKKIQKEGPIKKHAARPRK